MAPSSPQIAVMIAFADGRSVIRLTALLRRFDNGRSRAAQILQPCDTLFPSNRMSDSAQPRLPAGQQLLAPGKWPLIGEKVPAPCDGPWTLRVAGLVSRELLFRLEDLAELPQQERVMDIHCVTRWSVLDMHFSGVLLADLLERAGILPSARYVSFLSRSLHSHSTSLGLADSLRLGTLLATAANGQPISSEHGGPLRNIVPGRYFYKSVKWLCEIRLLERDELGTWERESGYHNTADPWQEQRYLAPTMDRRTAAALIASRDFAGRDLRSIVADDRDLAGLRAAGARLRDASFRRANLERADFSGANLSNAHFDGSSLQFALFTGADLEGASFHGARLAGVDFSSASLIGSSFVGEVDGRPVAARIDSDTVFASAGIEVLAPRQRDFIRDSPARLV